MNPPPCSGILSHMTERQFALDVVRKLQEAGFAALWAGGCVRDELLGLTPADYDVATNARPEQLRGLFKRRNEIGASFGVVQVIGPRGDDGEWLTIEVATFRSDVSYTDGRRPDAVVFSSPEEDAQRARLHHQRHVLRSGEGGTDRLCRRPGRPRSEHSPGHVGNNNKERSLDEKAKIT